MKNSIRTTVFILCALLFAALPANPASTADLRWYGYDEGVALAKKQGKKVFLYFWADWCTYCKKMEEETLTKKEVAALLSKNYIPIKINVDADQRLASEYFVRGLPTIWFLSEKGEKISNLPGYVAPDFFLPILDFIQTDSYKQMTFKEFLEKKK